MATDNGGVNNATRFVYLLKGFNDKWMKTTAGIPDITYMSLPSGSYTLCVRMLKDDGTMGEAESRLDITIGSPWYLSWWAWLCYVIVAVLLFYGRRIFIRQVRELKEWKRQRREKAENDSHETEQEPSDDVEEAVMMEDDE